MNINMIKVFTRRRLGLKKMVIVLAIIGFYLHYLAYSHSRGKRKATDLSNRDGVLHDGNDVNNDFSHAYRVNERANTMLTKINVARINETSKNLGLVSNHIENNVALDDNLYKKVDSRLARKKISLTSKMTTSKLNIVASTGKVEPDAGKGIESKKQLLIKPRTGTGKVNVYSWNDICITRDNFNMYWNPLFPKFPFKGEMLDKLQDSDWIRSKATRRMLGYINIAQTGLYTFKLLSRDGMEFMLFNNVISKDSVLSHASIETDDIIKQTKKLGMFDLYTKETEEIELKAGKRYPFDIAHSCLYFGRIELQIKKKGEKDFRTVDFSYLSPYHETPDVDIKLPDFFFFNKTSELREKFNHDKRLHFGDKTSLNSKTCSTGLKVCRYEQSYLYKNKELMLYHGQDHVQRDLIYPDDNTTFKGKDIYIRILDQRKAVQVANEVFDAISTANSRKYKLQSIVHVEENNETLTGKRYFVELDLEQDGKIYRFSDYFFKPNLGKPLCMPESYSNWRHDVMVYMICAVKNQRHWVQYLINSIEDLVKRTKDQRLNLMLVDFYSTDVDVGKLLKRSKLNYTFIQMRGNFSKVRALNEGAKRIADNDSIIFVMDLQLQIPDHIFDQSRKHTIQGKMTYCPILMRLQCGEHPEYTNLSSSVWMDIGYGMMSLYKSDWDRIGGMNEEMFKYSWGGEDWEFLDRVILGRLELVHQRLPGFYHIYHSTLGTWDGTKYYK